MKKERVTYIDNLKVFLTIMVVVHHAGQAYGPTGGVWVVKDTETISWLRSFFFLNASYMMGLYFFISGYFSTPSLNKKGWHRFLSDRLRRLGIPLLVFVFLIFGIFHYLLSDRHENYLVFLFELYFHKPPLATGHLWFVASLLLYSVILVLVAPLIRIKINKPGFPAQGLIIIGYVLLLGISSGFVRMYSPLDSWHTWIIPLEPAHLPQYLSLFLIGGIFQQTNLLAGIRATTSVTFGLMALIVFLLRPYFPIAWTENRFFEPMVEAILCVGLCLGLLEFFKRYLNRSNRFAELLSTTAYGIYLFHLLIVIGWQEIFLPVSIDGMAKFILVSILSLLSSLGVSYIIRKIKLVRSVV